MNGVIYALVLVMMAANNNVQTFTISNIVSESECHATATKVRLSVRYWVPLTETCIPYHPAKR